MESIFGQGGRAEAALHDCARYQIFGTLLPPTAGAGAARHAAAAPDTDDVARMAEALETCKAACLAHLEPFLEGYIWQKEPFQLEVVAEEGGVGGGERGVPPHLAGSTLFGDNVQDEWFIAWMLCELTSAFPTLTARVWDNDGEFLLIECAFHLPKWVKPNAVANRVFFHRGELHIVPPAATAQLGAWAKLDDECGSVTVDASLWLVRGGDRATDAAGECSTLAPPLARGAISSRLGGYPAAAREGMHSAYAVLPARLAHVLRVEPQLIAPAVEAFYERDPEVSWRESNPVG